MAQNQWKTIPKIKPHNLNFMHQSILKISKQYLDHVKNSGIPIDSAYLFGSFAKNKGVKNSDIDVCIVSKKFGKNYFNEGVKLAHLTHAIDDRLEPHPMHPKDLNDRYNTLAHEIKIHGILLTNKN